MKHIKTSTGEELALDIVDKKADDDRIVARVPLEISDFLLARDETWFRGVRSGALSADLQAHSMHVLPGENRGAGRLAGYSIEVFDGQRSFRRHYATQSLSPVANRKVMDLVKQKVATLADDFGFYLTTVRGERDGNGHGEIEPLKSKSRSEPLAFEDARLDDYLAASEPMPSVAAPPAEATDPHINIFVSDEVWQEGREMARRGGEDESAAVWTGRLMRDKTSGDLFMVLDACIEAEHAVEETYAVTFTGETSGRVRELLERRRRRLGRPARDHRGFGSRPQLHARSRLPRPANVRALQRRAVLHPHHGHGQHRRFPVAPFRVLRPALGHPGPMGLQRPRARRVAAVRTGRRSVSVPRPANAEEESGVGGRSKDEG